MMRRCRRAIRSFAADRRGLALLEFGFSLPIVLGIGLYGIETANLALTNMRVSQAALILADNASRVGVDSGLSTQQLREADINDVFSGLRQATSNWGLLTRGRVTLSSLENRVGVQMLHWQRCIGLKSGTNYDSTSRYTTKTSDGTDQTPGNAGTLAPLGMGDPGGAQVIAPIGSGVMFVEINYEYKPVVSTAWLPGGAARIHYIASFIVRDRRDFSQIYNPTTNPVTPRATCDKYSA